jgi:hypothetical protein
VIVVTPQEPQGRLVRPYAITGGRTEVRGASLELETQVVATPLGKASLSRYRWEAARVITLCEEPLALVEVAAKLDVPVGVARVVVADLVNAGALELRSPEVEESYTTLLERVLDGIRNL